MSRRFTEAELTAWAVDLAEQQARLDADQAAFEQRAAQYVSERAHDIAAALELVASWFPAGILIAPQGDPRPGGARTVH